LQTVSKPCHPLLPKYQVEPGLPMICLGLDRNFGHGQSLSSVACRSVLLSSTSGRSNVVLECTRGRTLGLKQYEIAVRDSTQAWATSAEQLYHTSYLQQTRILMAAVSLQPDPKRFLH
jgi:hypothetical protein